MTTINTALDKVRSLVGQRVGNGQCYGLVAYYEHLISPDGTVGLGAGINGLSGAVGNTINASDIGTAYRWAENGWSVVYPKSAADIKLGGIINIKGYNAYFGTGEYGHTGVITAVDGQTVTLHEQNVNGVERVVERTHQISPGFLAGLSSIVYPPKGVSAGPTASIKKVNVSLLEAGAMPHIRGVVIHNDAGSMTAEQYVEWLKPRNKELGIAHYYITKDCIARVVDTYKVAWHTGHPTGNGHYIGYEVCQSMSATDKDFLVNEDVTLMQATEDLLFYGLPINEGTVKLHHEFVPTTCPHRSMDLHGGTTASTKAYFIQRMKQFASLGSTVEEMLGKTRQVAATDRPASSAMAQKETAGSFKVQVATNGLRIRTGAGLTHRAVGTIARGVYTITATKVADGHTWGRLKSGAGWIALTYTKRV